MYINPKKKVLSKWCANHGVSPNTSSSMVVNTTTTAVGNIKIEDTTTNPCTISNYSMYSPTAPHLSLPSQSHIDNISDSWKVVQRDEDYFKRNNCRLSTSISLTYSREDSSCLEPLESGNIVLYSSLRYLLKHDFKLTSSTNVNLPQILFMRVDLIGGTIKEKINGVISHSSELSNTYQKVFKADSRLQIEKVQSYKQAVHFKLSLFDLSDLEHAICVLDSVSFNVFARKKQDGSVSPKTKKTKNSATKRSLSATDDNIKSSKQPKVEDAFCNNISNTFSYAQSINVTPSSVNNDMHLSDGSLSLLANVLTNPSNYLDDDEEPEHNLEIDDGEPVNCDNQLLCTYEHQLKELISHISYLSSEERAIALQSAIVALR
ncbi:predicted protein [Naegleria gruberi]|uniref:Predicted protein n=1 Tax=Naegleria gruberi TaxID=5762 RepID=D2VZA3_NAEGR|nr:uncharacterized protein NAEGRDRAFT_74420 [Naegleria gruberi]EFC37756.1 predicted protein [Naegleria gruberi]|eukprot:XP_002670500.1 predicted protein [Naegleria gruberi strain NEG-M]